MKQQKILKIVYIFLILLDIHTLIPWGFGIILIVFLLPFGLTIWLLLLHIMSLRALRTSGAIPRNLITQQVVAGTLLSLCVGMVVYTLVSLDCLDSCTGRTPMDAIPPAFIAFVVCMSAMFAVVHAARKTTGQAMPATPTAPTSSSSASPLQ